jgi:hypothetical protein
VNVVLVSSQWKGPGQYGRDTLLGISGVRIDNSTYYDLSAATRASVTVNPDGSGSLFFQDAPVSGQTNPTISGSVEWTCANHSG